MALSFGEIDDWDPEEVEVLTSAMTDRIAILSDYEDDVRSAGRWGSNWSSSAADMASGQISTIADEITDAAAIASSIRELAIVVPLRVV